MSCLFCKILEGSIPAQFIYEDEQCVALNDIHPQAPVHFLVMPRQHIVSLAEAGGGHQPMLGHLLRAASDIARQKGLGNGFRVVINTGPDGGQTVDHLHVHVLGGRLMTWPPG